MPTFVARGQIWLLATTQKNAKTARCTVFRYRYDTKDCLRPPNIEHAFESIFFSSGPSRSIQSVHFFFLN